MMILLVMKKKRVKCCSNVLEHLVDLEVKGVVT